ncbi:hypothetical protein [Alkalicoccus chagannorensis]|uniref:hypothetical protein n=1 Tax=Alkalicoccus chagannorensis TaxID=427072 RepID=UPI00047E430F|nr:hypothetical protein [Alkalicoccus chagannorensis]
MRENYISNSASLFGLFIFLLTIWLTPNIFGSAHSGDLTFFVYLSSFIIVGMFFKIFHAFCYENDRIKSCIWIWILIGFVTSVNLFWIHTATERYHDEYISYSVLVDRFEEEHDRADFDESDLRYINNLESKMIYFQNQYRQNKQIDSNQSSFVIRHFLRLSVILVSILGVIVGLQKRKKSDR